MNYNEPVYIQAALVSHLRRAIKRRQVSAAEWDKEEPEMSKAQQQVVDAVALAIIVGRTEGLRR